MTQINDTISTYIVDEIGVILSENPPVDALGYGVRDELIRLLDASVAGEAV